jgi:hypothetical protein
MEDQSCLLVVLPTRVGIVGIVGVVGVVGVVGGRRGHLGHHGLQNSEMERQIARRMTLSAHIVAMTECTS